MYQYLMKARAIVFYSRYIYIAAVVSQPNGKVENGIENDRQMTSISYSVGTSN